MLAQEGMRVFQAGRMFWDGAMENVKHISFHNWSEERVNYPATAVRWFSSRGPWEQKLLESRVFELKTPLHN